MKRASENKEFPYASKFVCYFEVFPDGTVAEISNDVRAVEPAFQRASEGTVKIYAVLPERYVSSLYEIDDINLLADAYGIAVRTIMCMIFPGSCPLLMTVVLPTLRLRRFFVRL